MDKIKADNEQRLNRSHNSGEEKRAAAQHVKAETQSWRSQRNQIHWEGEIQEKGHKSKQQSASLMWWGAGTTVVPAGWHLYLNNTLEIIWQEGLETGQQVSRGSETRLLQPPRCKTQVCSETVLIKLRAASGNENQCKRKTKWQSLVPDQTKSKREESEVISKTYLKISGRSRQCPGKDRWHNCAIGCT